ncbi:MAG: hypothetical protein OEW93_03300 [Candidatus Bathyarchaeota archaeon]|nr:hypothetical protein [Candidatus Bathyarchaeota archaeon]MDH5791078.1 hypothetical protein [Candidatus Bathyarchaeota archaeon]
MEKETLQRFSGEVMSLYALIVINIVGAGLAMSFGVATGVNNIFPMIADMRIQPLQAALTGLGLLGFGFAISWLVSSAKVFSDFDDLRDEFKKRRGKTNDEEMTQLIVQNMAFYRDNRPTIDRLMLGSRAAGLFFLLSAAVGVFNLLTNAPAGPLGLLTAVIGALICIAIGAVGLYCPSFFERYTRTWEQRLNDSVEAEKKLNRILEG